jgi:LmbE family N-acetylglucosaminyl deacetylase
MKKYIFLTLLSFLFFIGNVNAQTILCVAAHPDDEDGAALAYYSKLKGYSAYTIIYTRGEGGQNEIGPELNNELGKIRERETNEAAEIQGSKAIFLGFLDFGFSKTAKETFKMWGGKDKVLARIVYMIREIKPDVIITNHDTITTKPDRQHGNHQTVGISIYEAFEKAADPNYHPEQYEPMLNEIMIPDENNSDNGITKPWQVHKLYFRVYDTTKTNGVVTLDINQTDASGKTIEQIAFDALAKHRTQGMDKILFTSSLGVFRTRRYELVRSDKDYTFDANDLFSGIEKREAIKPLVSSFPTKYSYIKVSKADSLKILKNLKYDKNVRIGLIKTYDNTLENFLDGLGKKYTLIDSTSLANGLIAGYDVIILDLRAYLYRQDALQYNDRLMDFTNAGGNLIIFYNKPTDWNLGQQVSPYPIYITNERVTEEDAAVTVLKPEHPYFNEPNKIISSDWNGWVQERNIYLPSDDPTVTSSKYEKLLSMQDEDDPVPSTSLLIANFGKGTYTYCSLALYRQLKIFNEGASKLFLNMLSHRNANRRGNDN